MKLISKLVVLLAFACSFCITPYETPATFSDPILVVNGLITDQPDPYQVTVGLTSINSKITIPVYTFGASVMVFDDQGNQETLRKINDGKFEGMMKGVVGRSYAVRVLLADGSVYESTPELLAQGQPIENVVSTYEDLPQGSKTKGQFKTYVETTDPIEKGNYYRWTWKHYGVQTYCALYRNDFDPKMYAATCCDSCWNISQCETCITLANDQLSSGKKISQHLLDIPYDSKEPYFLSIQQLSLTKSAYQFWVALNEQINTVGGVFDPPPAAVRGNIHNVSKKDEQVLGYFGASAITTKTIFIDRANAGVPPYPHSESFIITGCVPCKENYFFTAKKPEGWN
jgi:hypothetical protein